MRVFVAEYRMHLPQSFSMKDKRQVRRSLFDYLQFHFNLSIAETYHLEDFKLFQFGLSMVNKNLYYLKERALQVEDIIFERAHGRVEILEKSFL